MISDKRPRTATPLPSDGFAFSLPVSISLWTVYLVLSLGPSVTHPEAALSFWLVGILMIFIGSVIGTMLLSKIFRVVEPPLQVRAVLMLLIISSFSVIFVKDSGLWVWVYFAVGVFQSTVPSLSFFLYRSPLDSDHILRTRIAEATRDADNAFGVGEGESNDEKRRAPVMEDDLDDILHAEQSELDTAKESVDNTGQNAPAYEPNPEDSPLADVDFDMAAIRLSDALSLAVTLQALTPYTVDFAVSDGRIGFFAVELIVVQFLSLLAGARMLRGASINVLSIMFPGDDLRIARPLNPISETELSAEATRVGRRHLILALVALSWGVCFCTLSKHMATTSTLAEEIIFRVFAAISLLPIGLLVRKNALIGDTRLKTSRVFFAVSFSGYIWLAASIVPGMQIPSQVFGFIGSLVSLVFLQVLLTRVYLDAVYPLARASSVALHRELSPVPYHLFTPFIFSIGVLAGLLVYRLSIAFTLSIATPVVMGAIAIVFVLNPASL